MSQPIIDTEALSDRFIGALETMCLVIADPIDPMSAAEVERHASIILGEGEHALNLHISASNGLLLEVATGLMGVGPEEIEGDEILLETLKELANVFGGEVIDLLGGEEFPFRPGIPVPEDNASDVEGATCVALDAIGETLVVSLSKLSATA